MRFSDRALAGLCFFVGSAAYLLLTLVAETAYPDYSTSTNFISDLGVGPTAGVWTAALAAVGLLGLVGTYLLYRSEHLRVLPLLLGLAAVGALGVAAVNENMGPMHGVFAFMAFLFGGLAAIFSYPLVKPPLRYAFPVLGVVGLAAQALFASHAYLGLGVGGMERMIALPVVLFEMSFGAYLAAPGQPAVAPETS